MLLQVVNEPQIKGISTLFGLVETNITRRTCNGDATCNTKQLEIAEKQTHKIQIHLVWDASWM